MSFLYEYMNADELEFAKEQAKFDNESLRLANEYKVLCMEHAVRLNDIETEVLLENYSDDNLTEMYIKEMAVFMEGVKDWWEKFKKWVKGIWDAILGKVKEVTPEAKEAAKKSSEGFEIPIDPSETKTFTKKVCETIRKITTLKKEDGTYDKEKIYKTVFKTTIAAGGIGAIAATIKKKTKINLDNADQVLDDLVESGKELTQTACAVSEDSTAGPIIQELVAKANELLNSGITAITSKFKSLASKAGEVVANIAGKGQKALPTDKDTFTKNDKQDVKAEMLRIARNWGILDKAKGNKINVNDMEKIYKTVTDKMKSGKAKNVSNDQVDKWRDVIKWMKDNNIFEFTLDDVDGSYYAEFEEDIMESVDGEFDVEAFLESHTDAEYEDIESLADLL